MDDREMCIIEGFCPDDNSMLEETDVQGTYAALKLEGYTGSDVSRVYENAVAKQIGYDLAITLKCPTCGRTFETYRNLVGEWSVA